MTACSIYTYRYYQLESNGFINKEHKYLIYGAGRAGISVKNELSMIQKCNLFY